METYRFYPPQMRARQVPYQLLAAGAAGCKHELLDEDWSERISVRDGIVFITYSCRHCGRQICQSLDEVAPPLHWNGVRN